MAALAVVFANSLANKTAQGELRRIVAGSPLGDVILAKSSPVPTSARTATKIPAAGIDYTPIGSIPKSRGNGEGRPQGQDENR